MIIVLGVDVSRETVGAVSHTNRDIFSFIFLYSHYIHQIMDRQYHQLSDLLGQRQHDTDDRITLLDGIEWQDIEEDSRDKAVLQAILSALQ